MTNVCTLIVGLVGPLLACGTAPDDPNGPLDAAVAAVEVDPDSAVLFPAGELLFRSTVKDASGNPLSGRLVSWQTDNQSVARVDGVGMVTAVAQGQALIRATSEGRSGEARVRVLSAPSGPVVRVDGSTRYQTMVGWEATAQAGHIECPATAYNRYRDELFDRVVNELGINRLRLPLQAGSENPTDYFSQFMEGRLTIQAWRPFWYASVNDNASATSIASSGFHFSELDFTVEKVVLPMKQRLEALGEKLYINLNYTDFGRATFKHRDSPEEYAEFILAAFQHLQNRYGWVPDAVEVILEPDNANALWSPTQIGRAIAAAGQRLAAAGFRPDFIAPSSANMGRAVTDFDAMMQVAGAAQYVDELAYHRYGGVSTANLTAIGARSSSAGIRTAMLEHIGSGKEDLYLDLTVGMNSAWQQYTLAFCRDEDRGGMYYLIDDADPNNPRVTLGSRARYLRQYFRYVRAGAVRVGATSASSTLSPVAFINANGRYVVVVDADAGGLFQIDGLPAGTYGINYTTASAFNVDGADVSITSGQALPVNLPASGVVTIFGR
jgi:O-glycosyl hydrolase